LYGTIPYKSPIGQLERQIKWRIQENGHYRSDKMVVTYSRAWITGCCRWMVVTKSHAGESA
jgi:hypothetical protein